MMECLLVFSLYQRGVNATNIIINTVSQIFFIGMSKWILPINFFLSRILRNFWSFENTMKIAYFIFWFQHIYFLIQRIISLREN